MNIGDRSKTLTAEELRRRYNLDGLEKDRKAININKENINKVNSEINNFAETVTKDIKGLQDQVDGNIATWFFSGVPYPDEEHKEECTSPASEWLTQEEKINHLGDLYYDQETGYAYRWTDSDGSYFWIKLKDSDITKALALANSAKDTADSKRRVFVQEPTPPYDVGDIWIKDDTDLYRCKIGRAVGSFNLVEWVRATNYTDDTVALGAQAELDEFKKTVEQDYTSNTDFYSTINSITSRVEETYTTVQNVSTDLQNNYYNQEQIDSMQNATNENITIVKNTVEQTLTATQAQIDVIQEEINNGVSKVVTTTGTFDSNGMHIQKAGEAMNSTLDWDGLVVRRDQTEVLTVRSAGVETENLTVRKYLTVKPIRIEQTKSMSDGHSIGLGFFYTGV